MSLCKSCQKDLNKGQYTRSIVYPWLCAQCALVLSDEKAKNLA